MKKIERKNIEQEEKYLRQVSTPVDFMNDDYKRYIEDLKEYVENNDVYAPPQYRLEFRKELFISRIRIKIWNETRTAIITKILF